MKAVGIIAGIGHLPILGARAAREQGWEVVVVSVIDESAQGLIAAATVHKNIPLTRYGRVIGEFLESGVRDVYVLGKLSKTLIHSDALDDEALQVLASVSERGDHAIIEAFLSDMTRRGLTVHSQLDLLQSYVVPSGFAAGRALTPGEQQDVLYGQKVARLLTDSLDVGQTAVVKDGVVLAVEAAEGTDATIRRGGQLGGSGVVVVKVKGTRLTSHDLPVIGLDTMEALAEAGAAVMAFEAGRTLLIDREQVVARAQELGIGLLALGGNGEIRCA